MARLVDDHRRAEAALRESERQLRKARDEIETKVAERTAELQRSEAYLAEARHLPDFKYRHAAGYPVV